MGAIISLRHILLIECDPLVRQTLAELLEGAGHRVTAADGLPVAGRFDLVLADPALPRPALAAAVGDGTPVLALSRPVRPGVLLARVDEALRAAAAAEPVRIGPWRFDPVARHMEDAAGRKVRLTDKEVAIIEHLRQAGGVVGREALLAEVWGYSSAVTTHTLETHIYRLRRKIEADPANAVLLTTEAGGYRLVP